MIAGIAIGCYLKTRNDLSLEEKAIQPLSATSSHDHHKKESFKFLAPFAVGEAPYYSHVSKAERVL